MAGLISAINTANANGQDDTINLASVGTYVLNAPYVGGTGLPYILVDNNHNLTVNGNNSTIARSMAPGTPEFRLLAIVNSSGAITPPSVTIYNTIFENGRISDINTNGGGLVTAGYAILNGCTIRNNACGGGGGISNGNGKLVMNGCTLNNNTGLHFGGGALRNDNAANVDAIVELTNCTFSGNSALNGGGTIDSRDRNDGGNGDSRVTLTHCTVVDGSIHVQGEFLSSSRIYLRNNLLKSCPLTLENTGAPSSAAFVTEGYNMSDGSGNGELTHSEDFTNTNPGLDPDGLKFNGGPTQTIALVGGSAAIDQGYWFSVGNDQRGAARPLDNPTVPNNSDGTDIGAYEASTDPIQNGVPSFIVTTTDDHNDGNCTGADCTLREALERTNSRPGLNTITFAPAVIGTITLQGAAGGQLGITDETIITGPGARLLTVTGFGIFRVFFITGSGSSVISGLTIYGGSVSGGTSATNSGGGIYNAVTLHLTDCTFDFNRASGGSGVDAAGLRDGGAGRGGAIFNAGSLALNRCTFKNNGATGGFGGDNPPDDDFEITTGGNGGSASGGAIFNDSGRSLTIYNCTFVANNAGAASGGSGRHGGNGGNGLGGGVYNLGTLSVYASTFSGNTGFGGSGGAAMGGFPGTAGLGAGGLAAAGGTSTLGNTISAGNSATGTFRYDISGVFNSSGYNLIGRTEGGSGFTATGDQTGSNASPLNPQLGSLANNGGPTDTMLPLANSTAIDRGYRFGLATDQRGLPRPLDIAAYPNAPGGDGSDIGALEVDPPQAGPTFIVTTVVDFDDGLCGAGHCSLREAITAANAAVGGNTINFAPGVTGTIQLGGALPTVSGNLVLQGPGANLLTVRRNTGGDYRIFTITNGTTTGPVVSLTGLTINNGKAPSPAPLNGGGIQNDHGDLTLTNCVVSGNIATNGAGINSNGATSGSAKLTLTGCTLNNNVASGFGGAINNNGVQGGNAMASLTNCTVHGNDAVRGAAVWTSGASSGSAALSLFNCTIADNSAPFASIYNDGTSGSGVVTLRSTILKAGASGANIANVNNAGTVTSQGYNLSSDSGSNFLIATGDQPNANPLLGLLADNGGPTPTRLLLSGSPALDKGKSFGLTTDQRGLARLSNSAQLPDASGGDGTDIGALEATPFGSQTDSDGDGIPDEWEAFYGVDNPNADEDNDGRTNLQEYGEGTDPRNSSSFRLYIISIARSGNDIVVTFNGVAGKTFQLQRQLILGDVNWQDGATVTPGTTASAQLPDPNGIPLGKAFYRVRLLP